MLPCGVRAALAAMGDRSTPDRGHFALEIIRRLHHSPVGPDVQRKDALTALITHLDRCSQYAMGTAVTQNPTVETLPLPLPAPVWVDTVFGGRVDPKRLAAAILESRNASLLYVGLLSVDDGTRNWIATRPDLIAEIATRHAAAFTLIAPGLRVTNAGVQVPGGPQAEPVWEGLVGRSAKNPVEFIRVLLSGDDRHLPYMFGTLGQLSPSEVHLALNLDAPDPDDRIASGRRLHAVYVQVGRGWRVEMRAFNRPTYDPALLVADLRHDDEGRPVLPGTRRFWELAFAQNPMGDDDPKAIAESEPVDFAWLCERVFEGDVGRQRRRYHQVLFGSRILGSPNRDLASVDGRRLVGKDQVHAAVEAVRAAERYPALVAALERAGVVDVSPIAAAARRAGQLAGIDNVKDAVRASAQFQGLLMLLQRATLRDSLSTNTFAELVATLAAVDLADDDTYRGGLVRWLDAQLRLRAVGAASPTASPTASRTAPPTASTKESARITAATLAARDDEDFESQPVERVLLDLVAGPSTADDAPRMRLASEREARDAPATPRIVEWEGTRYRVDLAAAEAARLERLRGEQPRPYLSAARALIGMADMLRDPKVTREALARESRVFERVADAVGWTGGQDWSDGQHWLGDDSLHRAREVAAALERAGKRGDRADAARLAPAILLLADELFARGVTHLVYATALGRPERAGFSAEEAAGHHDFGASRNGVRFVLGPWEHPATSSGPGQSRVTGSLLGLDVALAPFSLVRLSSRLPPNKPTLNENDRRALIESVVLAGELGDEDRDRIVSAIRKGRDKLAAVATADAVAANVGAREIADAIGMTGARRSLLLWNATRVPDRVATFLSPGELLWLGLGPARIDARFHAWGAPAKARLGCLCLQLLDRRSLEPYSGRWGSGIFVSAFPDLNLRLAELLAELRMPAPLLGPILTSATLELVNNTASRDADDRRALVEFVLGLTLDRVEQYLALLTTDGPLVPIGKARETSVSSGVP